MVNNMKRRKQKANTSKPASSPPLNVPAQALSGDETKRRMALVNADREIVRKIMTEPGPRWEPQSPPRAENAANFFRWAANATFRARRGRRPAVKQARRRWSSRAFVRLGRAFPPALPTLARVRLQRLSPIGNSRNPPPRAENAANFFRSSARARAGKPKPMA